VYSEFPHTQVYKSRKVINHILVSPLSRAAPTAPVGRTHCSGSSRSTHCSGSTHCSAAPGCSKYFTFYSLGHSVKVQKLSKHKYPPMSVAKYPGGTCSYSWVNSKLYYIDFTNVPKDRVGSTGIEGGFNWSVEAMLIIVIIIIF